MLHDKDLVSIQEVRSKVEKAYNASQVYRKFTQEQVDAIVERMAAAATAKARELAEMAVRETGYGNVKDKIAKNLLNSDLLPRRMRGMKTIGVLRELPEEKIIEIGVPMGVVAAILPTTNPTSTAIFKTLISLKAGNAVVISPHPSARECTCYTADLLYKAALEAGAPEDVMQCITNPTLDGTMALMRHERTGVILATGGLSMVRSAYSSGNPALGVGPGNVPVLVERTADLREAVAKVVEGKSFDYGTVCSSEQALVAEQSQRDAIIAELKANKAFFCNDQQKEALRRLLFTPKFTVNPQCVGQAPTKIAEMAGFAIPPDTSIIVAEISKVGKPEPLSAEKLSPVLALLFVKDWDEQLTTCESLLRFGGLGHTCVIFSRDDARIREFGLRMPAFRVLVNTPSPSGSVGVTTNIWPSMTLGCGAMGGNSTSDNTGPQHLFNIKRISYAVRTVDEALPMLAEVSGAASVDRNTVAAAVERYLQQKGVAVTGPAPSMVTSSVRTVAAEVVDKFLAGRAANPAPAPAGPQPANPASANPAPSGPTCGCQVAAQAAPPPPPKPPEPVPVVDFVCESDVRDAIQAGKKIFVGPKTILTPSARDLGASSGVIVQAQR